MMDLEEAVARAIAGTRGIDYDALRQWATMPHVNTAAKGVRKGQLRKLHNEARAAIKAVESYRVPEFRKEGGG
jgi:hypothetical protein